MTAKELAKLIGVSEATMSLVINGKHGISNKTRTMVITRMKELGYGDMLQNKAPGDQGMSAAFGQSRNAGENDSIQERQIAFVNFKDKGELLGMNSFFPLILDGIERTVRENGCRLTVLNIEKAKLDEQLKWFHESRCAGLVLFATEMKSADAKKFAALNIPFVVLDNEFYDVSADSVKLNNQQGTWLAARFLAEEGHKRVGYLSSGVDINSFHERQRCAVNALEESGIEDAAKHIYTIGYPHESAEEGMMQLLKSRSKEELPTAFLTDNDLVAVGAMRAMQAMGYRVPEDFSLVGFDDRPICTMISPRLTTVAIPRETFGSSAVDRLINILNGRGREITTIEINCELVKRDTVYRLK
ncbi:MAG: LacI family DNA-binding transcriptional regulator [Eubacterium sp.]|nr:LacI family DNA-binding transcriptional regulator [Eubacterium sp.]